jgi:protein dithiol oxidoreductase (disulfide-forming)
MLTRTAIVVLFLAASVSACAKDPAPVEPAAEEKPPTVAATAPAAEEKPATTPPTQAEIEAATRAQESTGDPADSRDRGDAALERLAALPADQQLPNGRWKAGQHYMPIVPAQPTNVAPGEVEIVEVFWYGCPHCYALEPVLASWDKSNADYVKLLKVPVMWSPGHGAHAKLFYTLEALGRADLHQRVFESYHQRRNPLLAQTDSATRKLHTEFARANGIDDKQFLQAYDSFTVNANLQRAQRLTDAYRVTGVPVMVVNGKYTTDVSMAGGEKPLLALLDDLAASERR